MQGERTCPVCHRDRWLPSALRSFALRLLGARRSPVLVLLRPRPGRLLLLAAAARPAACAFSCSWRGQQRGQHTHRQSSHASL